MALASLKVSAAASVQGQTQPGTVQIKSVSVTQAQTTKLVLIAGGGQVGPQLRPWVTQSADYELNSTDGGVLVTASCTITLPALPIAGQTYGVKTAADGVLPIVVSIVTGTAGVIEAGTIGVSGMQITGGGACVLLTIAPNGTDWLIVSYFVPSLVPVPVPPPPVIS